jgi:DNA-binding response OmpR family regulator
MRACHTSVFDGGIIVKCLLVEDDARVAELERRLLEAHGIEVIVAGTIAQAMVALSADPGIILLDLSLPGAVGFQSLREMRRVSQLPIIVVTGRSDGESVVQGLCLGADDYIVKPFATRELVARMAAVLRRCAMRTSLDGGVATVSGDLQMDHATRCVTVKSESIQVTRKEFEILAILARLPGAVIRREQLLGEIWGVFDPSAAHSLESHVTALRRKLRPHCEIKAARGIGYKLLVASGVPG